MLKVPTVGYITASYCRYWFLLPLFGIAVLHPSCAAPRRYSDQWSKQGWEKKEKETSGWSSGNSTNVEGEGEVDPWTGKRVVRSGSRKDRPRKRTEASSFPSGGSHDGAKAKEKAIVAVFDIEDRGGVGLSRVVLSRMSDYISLKLSASNRYVVVPRDQIKSRLAKQKVKSYRSCFKQSCQIQIGQELAAQKSLATTVIKLGDVCTVTSVVYDLKKATSESGVSVDGKCSEEEIVQSVRELVGKLK